MTAVQQLQSKVIGPSDVINYSSVIRQSYPTGAIQVEPFIGFKVLCHDRNATITNPRERLAQIDSNLGFLRGTGCIIRETNIQMPDGLWVITLPVPRSQANTQINNLLNVLMVLERSFGIVSQNMYEINVSGRCFESGTERCLGGLMIPPRYLGSILVPDNTPYKYGSVVRINDEYMCLRTKWNLQNTSAQNRYEDLVVLSQLISSIYH